MDARAPVATRCSRVPRKSRGELTAVGRMDSRPRDHPCFSQSCEGARRAAEVIPRLVGGSADLNGSNGPRSPRGPLQPNRMATVPRGVREHGMMARSTHGGACGFRPYGRLSWCSRYCNRRCACSPMGRPYTCDLHARLHWVGKRTHAPADRNNWPCCGHPNMVTLRPAMPSRRQSRGASTVRHDGHTT